MSSKARFQTARFNGNNSQNRRGKGGPKQAQEHWREGNQTWRKFQNSGRNSQDAPQNKQQRRRKQKNGNSKTRQCIQTHSPLSQGRVRRSEVALKLQNDQLQGKFSIEDEMLQKRSAPETCSESEEVQSLVTPNQDGCEDKTTKMLKLNQLVCLFLQISNAPGDREPKLPETRRYARRISI